MSNENENGCNSVLPVVDSLVSIHCSSNIQATSLEEEKYSFIVTDEVPIVASSQATAITAVVPFVADVDGSRQPCSVLVSKADSSTLVETASALSQSTAAMALGRQQQPHSITVPASFGAGTIGSHSTLCSFRDLEASLSSPELLSGGSGPLYSSDVVMSCDADSCSVFADIGVHGGGGVSSPSMSKKNRSSVFGGFENCFVPGVYSGEIIGVAQAAARSLKSLGFDFPSVPHQLQFFRDDSCHFKHGELCFQFLDSRNCSANSGCKKAPWKRDKTWDGPRVFPIKTAICGSEFKIFSKLFRPTRGPFILTCEFFNSKVSKPKICLKNPKLIELPREQPFYFPFYGTRPLFLKKKIFSCGPPNSSFNNFGPPPFSLNLQAPCSFKPSIFSFKIGGQPFKFYKPKEKNFISFNWAPLITKNPFMPIVGSGPPSTIPPLKEVDEGPLPNPHPSISRCIEGLLVVTRKNPFASS